jgi:hypothetical protein
VPRACGFLGTCSVFERDEMWCIGYIVYRMQGNSLNSGIWGKLTVLWSSFFEDFGASMNPHRILEVHGKANWLGDRLRCCQEIYSRGHSAKVAACVFTILESCAACDR